MPPPWSGFDDICRTAAMPTLAGLKPEDYLFPSRLHDSLHLGTRQFARILGYWVDELGLDRADYGTHSVRRTKATLIYRRTENLRAAQLLIGLFQARVDCAIPRHRSR